MSEPLSVCIAGATGWTGPALVRGVLDAPDLSLRSAVSRSAAGRDLGEALGGDALGVPVFAGVAEALDGSEVLVDFTSATAVEVNHQADAASRRGSSHVSAVTAAPSTASWTRLTSNAWPMPPSRAPKKMTPVTATPITREVGARAA